MKKITAILLIIIVSASCLFAAGSEFDFAPDAFEPSRSSSTSSISYKLYKNPASLYGNKFKIDVPNIAFTAYNDSKVFSDSSAAQTMAEILAMNFDRTKLINLLTKFVENVGTNNGMVVKADLQTGFEYKNFAFELATQVKIHSYSEGTSIVNTVFYPEVNAAASVGYSYRVYEKDDRSVDVGASIRFSYRAYTDPVDATTLSEGFDDLIYYTGYATPVNVSVSFNFFNEILKVNASLTNINGKYHFQSYDNLEKAIKLSSESIAKSDLNVPASLSIGFVVDPKLKRLNPSLEFEFSQINTFLSEDMANESYEVLKYITLKGNLSIFNIADVYAAFDGGYLSVGATFGYKGNQIEVHYGWEELGKLLGQKPTDYLTFAIKCGWDKN